MRHKSQRQADVHAHCTFPGTRSMNMSRPPHRYLRIRTRGKLRVEPDRLRTQMVFACRRLQRVKLGEHWCRREFKIITHSYSGENKTPPKTKRLD